MSKANIDNKRQQKQKVMSKANIVKQETVETQSNPKLILSRGSSNKEKHKLMSKVETKSNV